MTNILVNLISLVISTGSFLYTFHVLYNFVSFMSSHNAKYKILLQEFTENNLTLSILRKLIMNTSLLSLFMLQHSLMSIKVVKSIYQKLQILDLQRSLYNIFSALTLHVMMVNWQPVPWISIWNVDTSSNNNSWFFFNFCHFLAWSIIYSGCIMLDIAELTGLKQIFYKISGRPSPMLRKSKEFQRYLAHMRHPSFTGFLMILWIHPFMTIDRFLMASIFSIYMLMMWTIDEQDCHYHAKNVLRKHAELS